MKSKLEKQIDQQQNVLEFGCNPPTPPKKKQVKMAIRMNQMRSWRTLPSPALSVFPKALE